MPITLGGRMASAAIPQASVTRRFSADKLQFGTAQNHVTTEERTEGQHFVVVQTDRQGHKTTIRFMLPGMGDESVHVDDRPRHTPFQTKLSALVGQGGFAAIPNKDLWTRIRTALDIYYAKTLPEAAEYS